MLKCSDNTLYSGITTDLGRRIKEHNGEREGGARYTRGRRPVKLVYEEVHKTRSEAQRREAEIKQMNRKEKLHLIKPVMKKIFKLRPRVWIYPGDAAWHFITIDKKHSREIKEECKMPRRGFGAIPVLVTIGDTSWNTSIFPDSKSGTYLLPLKKKVRDQEGIYEGDEIDIMLKVGKI